MEDNNLNKKQVENEEDKKNNNFYDPSLNNKKEHQNIDPSVQNQANTVTNTREQEEKSNIEKEPLPELSAEEKLKSEYNLLNDKYIRLYSEYENYRRRTAKERIELIKAAGQEVIVALLPILDDFDRALISINKSTDINAVRDGVKLVHNKFKGILEQNGLKGMESMGVDFNADLHDAITNAPAPKNKLIGKIIDVLEKGYYLNNKVIRHAKVVVGN